MSADRKRRLGNKESILNSCLGSRDNVAVFFRNVRHLDVFDAILGLLDIIVGSKALEGFSVLLFQQLLNLRGDVFSELARSAIAQQEEPANDKSDNDNGGSDDNG